jgi:hypothetical protein
MAGRRKASGSLGLVPVLNGDCQCAFAHGDRDPAHLLKNLVPKLVPDSTELSQTPWT